MSTYTMTADLNIKKSIHAERAAYRIAMTVCGLSVLYLLSAMITGHAWLPLDGIQANSTELSLSLLQCLLGVAALHLPMLAARFIRIRLPAALCIVYYAFVLCGTVLGEMFSLYYAIPIWDSILHLASGMMAGMLGSILIMNFFEKIKCQNRISPIFVAVAAVCFALCVGVAWEIYEFAVDSLLGLNMQKFLLQDGTELIGQAALVDTMKDLLVDMLGALIAAVASYVSLKKKQGWLYAYQTDSVSLHISRQDPPEYELPRSA